jgi:hypothetical protein
LANHVLEIIAESRHGLWRVCNFTIPNFQPSSMLPFMAAYNDIALYQPNVWSQCSSISDRLLNLPPPKGEMRRDTTLWHAVPGFAGAL